MKPFRGGSVPGGGLGGIGANEGAGAVRSGHGTASDAADSGTQDAVFFLFQGTEGDTTIETMVFVDGSWVGCCESSHALVERYRALRREGRLVDPRTSIVWNPVTDDVEFLLEAVEAMTPPGGA